MRVSLARATAVAIVALLLFFTVNGAVHAQSVAPAIMSAPPGFGKIVIDANGNQTSGPVKAGDVIKYVLTVDSTMTGPSAIVDKLSINQTYLNGSLETPPDWTYNQSQVPYSVGNQMTYTHMGTMLAPGFTIEVPVSDASQPSAFTDKDGTLPITVAGNIYAIYHHLEAGSAQIMCFNGLSLAPCPTGSGAAWPRSISATDDVATPSLLRHAIWSGKIYYSAARAVPTATGWKRRPGIGCFDSATQLPCTGIAGFVGGFFPLSILWNPVVALGLNRYMTPIVADPADPRRIFIQADDNTSLNSGSVYCKDVSGGNACAGWTTPTLSIGPNGAGVGFTQGSTTIPAEHATSRDMIVATVSGQQRLFIQHPGTTNGAHAATISCLALPNGTPCGGWINAVVPSGRAVNHGALTPVLDSTGSATQICVHHYKQHSSTSQLPSCFNTSNGTFNSAVSGTTTTPLPGNATRARVWVGAFRMPPPAPPRLLYPTGGNTTVECRDFPANTPCTAATFTPEWGPATTRNFSDYGYAVDPTQPKRCLLGLGDKGVVWRFTTTGGFGQNGCTTHVQAEMRVDDLFCGYRPQGATWKRIDIVNPPQKVVNGILINQLFGGTVTLTGAAVNAANNNQPIQISFTGTAPIDLSSWNIAATGTLDIDFAPTYFSPPVSNGYQLRVSLDSNVAEQICYKATVQSCGAVTNQAAQVTGTLGNFQVRQAATDLGNAICHDISAHKGYGDNNEGYVVQVANQGAPVQGKIKVVVQDFVPPGLSITAINALPPWSCSPNPVVVGPGTITCSYEVAAGSMLPLGPLPNIGLVSTGTPAKQNCVDTALLFWLTLPGNIGGFWLPMPETSNVNNHACGGPP